MTTVDEVPGTTMGGPDPGLLRTRTPGRLTGDRRWSARERWTVVSPEGGVRREDGLRGPLRVTGGRSLRYEEVGVPVDGRWRERDEPGGDRAGTRHRGFSGTDR